MSSSSSSSSSRGLTAIPNSLRKTIQDLKEIAKNHSEDEIYTMLKECSMDPNETAQKLLLQDPFHEVKRKRDKRKENIREPADTRWRPASQSRGGRGGGRANHSSRNISNVAGGERNIGKENGIHQVTGKGDTSSSSATSQDTAIYLSSSVASLPNGPAKTENQVSLHDSTPKDSNFSGGVSVKENSVSIASKKDIPAINDAGSLSVPCMQNSNHSSSKKPASGSGLYGSASDSVLITSLDGSIPGNAGSIKCGVGSQQTAVEVTINKVGSRDASGSNISSVIGKDSSEMNYSCTQVKMQGKSLGPDGNQVPDASSQATLSLSHSSSASSRPSSNYSNRSQQLSSMQKVGPAKEWKPKSTNVKPAPLSGKIGTSDVEPTTDEASVCALPISGTLASENGASALQKKLEELQVSDKKHVIIPNHLQVPESERTGLSFGSFDANFALPTSFVNDAESDKGSVELSESSQEIEENAEKSNPSTAHASANDQEVEYADHPQSPAKVPTSFTSGADQSQSPVEMPENLTSREPNVSSSISTVAEYDLAKPEAVAAPDSAQYSVVQTAPTYSNFGLVPQMIGNQFATFEGADPQARDASRIPSFLVQQPFDPATSYYTSVYRPTAVDGDGRFSPFFAPAASAKYSGNIAILPQTGQSLQEGGNSLVLPTTGQAPLVTQAAGGVQSSVAVSQQSLPVFRQPPGVHISHYPPSYLPYNQYFSPFYIPSPSMHPFLSNAAFPQQPPTGNIYSAAPGAAGAAPVKYAISQYKPTTNAGNPNHIGMPAGYGTYSPGAVTSGTSSGSEDLSSSQYKENNVYIAGQQTEGSVWIPTPGRDIPAMQATSFYNLPTQGQHMTFPGIYHHPGQTVAAGTVHPMLQPPQPVPSAVEMGGPPAGVYQQPQRTQINWVNNY